MKGRVDVLRPQFVDLMPDDFEEGVLYISVRYKSVQHLCCCGCKRAVVTPLSPTGWRIMFDGRSVSLSPSVGSWQKECGSHYFITENAVRWARRWTQEESAEALRDDVRAKSDYYSRSASQRSRPPPDVPEPPERWSFTDLWHKLKRILS